jgi:hypothetical protein
MPTAFGYQFLDHDNRLIEPLQSAFSEIHRIRDPAIRLLLRDPETVENARRVKV